MYVLNHIELCVKYLYIQKMSERKDTCGPIYHIKCKGKGDQQCKHDYIGETERTLKARFLEHSLYKLLSYIDLDLFCGKGIFVSYTVTYIQGKFV